MTKQITTRPSTQPIQSGKPKIMLATSSMISLAGLGSLIFYKFTILGTLALAGGIFVGIGSYVIHHIKSGAYLPQEVKKGLKQKLIQLKFRSESKYEKVIEECLEWVKNIEKKKELLDKTLRAVFSPTEMTFIRYQDAGLKALSSIEENISEVAETLERIKLLENDDNQKTLEERIPVLLDEINSLGDAYEKLIISFDQSRPEKDREEVFMQLEELANRTERYFKK